VTEYRAIFGRVREASEAELATPSDRAGETTNVRTIATRRKFEAATRH
jgi:hypothetical protein